MKKILFVFFIIVGFTAKSAVIVLEGKYQLRNIFVLNSVNVDGVGFCVFEVTVNGKVTADELNSNAFEIDLSQYGLKLGDDVFIRISYRDDCTPTILNPGALKPLPTFEVKKIEISTDNIVKWTTLNEQGQIPFIVQQKKWNKWVNIGEITGNGTSNENSYEYKIAPISGKNEIRIIQKGYDGKLRQSEIVEFTSDKTPVTFAYDRKKQLLTFTSETGYEIYNLYGQITKKGFGSDVDVSSLSKNKYYITYDNSYNEFVKN
jgi:hypothetical protein